MKKADQFNMREVKQADASITVVKLRCGVQAVIAASNKEALNLALKELIPEHDFSTQRFQSATITQS